MSYCYEKADSLSIKVSNRGSSASNIYVVIGETSELNAIASTNAASNVTYDFSLGTSPITLVRSGTSASQTGPESWEVSVDYAEQDNPDTQQRPEGQEIGLSVKWDFDTTGQTQKITIAKEEVARAEIDSAYPAPDMKGAIGWDGKQLNGADIVIPSLKIKATAPYNPNVITVAWIANLSRNTGKTNKGTWQGFKEGELLYIGSTGTKEIPLASGVPRSKPFEFTHSFEASENQPDYKQGGITLGEKKGWDYAWVKFEKADDSNKIVYPKAVHAYIDRVYDQVDFKTLFGF